MHTRSYQLHNRECAPDYLFTWECMEDPKLPSTLHTRNNKSQENKMIHEICDNPTKCH